jgi:Zn-finger nucleic acid-binding protein
MQGAYREGNVRCPACGEPMRREHTSNAVLEVCDACEGVWIDWFEGEVHAVAVEHEAARRDRGTPLPSRPSSPPISGSLACPRCQRALVAELYPFTDAKRDDLLTGVDVLRCTECAGAFVPRSSAHLLLERLTEAKTQSPWEALGGLVQRLFTRS